MAENGTNYSQEFIQQLNNAPAKQPINTKFLLIGGGALVALIIIVLMIMTANAPKKANITSVLARTRSVAKVANDYHKLLKDTGLRSLNSSLSVALANFNRDAESYYQANAPKEQAKKGLKNLGVDLSKTTEFLDGAELNNKLDRNYAIQIAYQLDLVIVEQEKLLSQTRGENLTKILTQGLKDLKQIQTGFKELTLN